MASLTYNDGVLLLSLLYSCMDLRSEWGMFDTCAKPIHHWLLVSYSCVIGSRLVHLIGAHLAQCAAGSQGSGASSDFLLDLRHKNALLPRVLTLFTWLVALPLFVVCTAVGTAWLWQVRRDSPQCMPTSTHMLFSGFWLALCYVWIFFHLALGAVAALLERRARRAEGNLREIEDDDVVSRWGQVSQLAGLSPLAGIAGASCGLSPSEIRALPEATLTMDVEAEAAEDCECSICVDAIEQGDKVRRLPACGHCFHKACIDLWLLRRADCPLCKRAVPGTGSEGCGC